jgi:hypothetical protein
MAAGWVHRSQEEQQAASAVDRPYVKAVVKRVNNDGVSRRFDASQSLGPGFQRNGYDAVWPVGYAQRPIRTQDSGDVRVSGGGRSHHEDRVDWQQRDIRIGSSQGRGQGQRQRRRQR